MMLGAFAERMKFSAYLSFIVLWVLIVYCPLAHMVWGGGWIGADLGALDFAGGGQADEVDGARDIGRSRIIGRHPAIADTGVPVPVAEGDVVGAGGGDLLVADQP